MEKKVVTAERCDGSVARIRNPVKTPATLGVPETTPVAVLIVTPGGNRGVVMLAVLYTSTSPSASVNSGWTGVMGSPIFTL